MKRRRGALRLHCFDDDTSPRPGPGVRKRRREPRSLCQPRQVRGRSCHSMFPETGARLNSHDFGTLQKPCSRPCAPHDRRNLGKGVIQAAESLAVVTFQDEDADTAAATGFLASGAGGWCGSIPGKTVPPIYRSMPRLQDCGHGCSRVAGMVLSRCPVLPAGDAALGGNMAI